MGRGVFNRAVERYQRRVFTYARYLLSDTGDAEDVTQEVLISLCLCAALGIAQTSVESHPGFFPLSDLNILSTMDAEVDINLHGSILKLVSGATDDDDPELSDVMSGLEGIRVLVGAPDSAQIDALLAEVDQAAAKLQAEGWQRIVKVRDEEEGVHIFIKENGSVFEGLTVLAVDGVEEVALITIVGAIDPAQLGKLIDDLDDLGGVDLDMDID